MKTQQIRPLIDAWEDVREITSPSRLSDDPARRQALAEVSVLSGRRSTWGVCVCLMGFAQETSQDVHEVLGTVAAEPGAQSPGSAGDFIDFCSDVMSVPRETAISAANIVYEIVKPTRIKPVIHWMTQLQLCLKMHPLPEDKEGFDRCISGEAG